MRILRNISMLVLSLFLVSTQVLPSELFTCEHHEVETQKLEECGEESEKEKEGKEKEKFPPGIDYGFCSSTELAELFAHGNSQLPIAPFLDKPSPPPDLA